MKKKQIDWSKVSKKPEVIKLIQEIIALEKQVRKLDKKALINWQLEELCL